MATNDFLPFANGGGANVLTQAQYAALTTLLSGGYQSGVANSAQMNKTWRQSSIMAAVLGQFAADYSGNNSTDDGTTTTLEANLVAAIRSATKTGVILADTGAANAYTAVNAPPLVAGTWVDGVVQQVRIAHANTSTSTYAPDGLTAIPIYGLGLQPLQGGELALNGIAILVRMTITGVNSGNPIAVLMECAGGAQQVAPATQSQHAPQMGQVAGVVGSARNLAMSVTAASATATLTADEIIVETALGGVRYCLANFSKTINLATTGAGGMDTGTAPVSGYVALYAIYNPTTGTAALLAQNANANRTEVYSGANMPAGFTASALLGVAPTNASSQFQAGLLNGRRWIGLENIVYNANGGVALTSLSLASAIPINAKRCSGNITGSNTNAGASGLVSLYSNSAGNVGRKRYEMITAGAASTNTGTFADLGISTPQTCWFTIGSGTGTPGALIAITEYEV
jgi:hypothetical protein